RMYGTKPTDDVAALRDYEKSKLRAAKYGIKIAPPPGVDPLAPTKARKPQSSARTRVVAFAPSGRQPEPPKRGGQHDQAIAKLRNMAAKARSAGDHLQAAY